MTKHLLVLIALFASNSIADTTIPYDDINRLHVYSESGIVYFDHKIHDCSNGSYYLPMSHPNFDTLVSLLLAAELSNRRVQLRIKGCNEENKGQVTGVFIED